MASKTNSRIGRKYYAGAVAPQLNTYSIQMLSQDISKWKKAIDAAWSVLNPDRRLLQEMYTNLVIDGHTEAVIEKRVTAITNRKIEFFVDGKEGETPEDIQEYITGAPWFQDLLTEAMLAVAYGYSLIEMVPRGGFVNEIISLDRQHVIPEQDMIVYDKYIRNDGINYITDPKASKYLLFVGKEKDYGKLMTAAQYIIYKRGGFADWSQFAELYGMPIKVAKYDPFDDVQRRKLDQDMAQMGAAPNLTLPKGVDFELLDTSSQGKSEIFRDMIDLCNSEISKIFLGQTLTTDPGRNGARALGDIHKEVEESINLADCIRMEYLLNWQLSDKLREIGYNLPKGRFVFPQTVDLPLTERIKIDVELAKQVAISDEYWYNTYGVEKGDDIKDPDKPKPAKPKKDNPDDGSKPIDMQKKMLAIFMEGLDNAGKMSFLEDLTKKPGRG